MVRFIVSLLLSVVTVSLIPHDALAQFGGSPSQTLYAPPKFGENNPHLKKLLTLQYQMQILRRLIEREKSVNQMVQSGVAIGLINPAIPKPEHDLCEQIPANIPCAQAYSDMYPNFLVNPVDNVAALPDQPLVPLNPLTSLVTDESLGTSSTEEIQLTEGGSAALFWMDVTCMQEKCSAIITPDPKNPRARYRVLKGETLPDGAVISTISAAGVKLEQNNKTITLEPAPQA